MRTLRILFPFVRIIISCFLSNRRQEIMLCKYVAFNRTLLVALHQSQMIGATYLSCTFRLAFRGEINIYLIHPFTWDETYNN